MEKKELKERFLNLYREHYDANNAPDVIGIAKFVNVLAHAIAVCGEAKADEAIGHELVKIIKSCTKVNKRSSDVELTKFLNEIGYYEEVLV